MAERQRNPDGIDAHIPYLLVDPVIVVRTERPYTGEVPTIFVGFVHEEFYQQYYTDRQWQNDAERIGRLFRFDVNNNTFHFKIKTGNQAEEIDYELLRTQTDEAIQMINRARTKKLRIIGLGFGWSNAIPEALESLIRAWNMPLNEKEIQLVAVGDSKYAHYLKFCQSICLKQLCNQVQYYNTMDYKENGCLRSDIGRILQDHSPSGAATPTSP